MLDFFEGRRPRWFVGSVPLFAACVATIVWSLVAGKDVNWDQLNYHFYSAYSFATGRLSQDFMAANLQSYFNPLAYLPFYGMVRQGWHSVAIASVLASVHALNIVLAYLITRETTASEAGIGLWAPPAGAILTFLSPVFLLEAGTTFADISTAIFVLLAVLLLLRQRPTKSWWCHYALLAGLAGGAAAGLKLSNVVFTPALAVMLMFIPLSGRERVRAMSLLVFGGVIGVIFAHGYWSYLLWQEFKNPFFPLFNSVFGSPDYPLISHKHERFLPDSFWDVLLFPIRAMSLRSWIYVESVSPDLRFMALYLLASFGTVTISYRLFRKLRLAGLQPPLIALSAFFVCAYILWICTSGNGRYGVVVSLMVGPMVVSWANALFRKRVSVLAFLAALTVLQIVHLQHGQYRWDEGHWTSRWFDETVPRALAQEPYLYLGIGAQSNSYVAPFLSPQSAFMNPIGQMSFDVEGPGGKRIASLLERYSGRVRMLGRAPNGGTSERLTDSWVWDVNALVSRFNMVLDTESCLVIETDGPPYESGTDFHRDDASPRRLVTCELKDNRSPTEIVAERMRVQAVVQQVIEWCPKMFKPAYAVIERKKDGWFANFSDSDIVLRIDNSKIFMSQIRSNVDIFLGELTYWEKGSRRPNNCSALPRQPRQSYNFD